MASSTFKSLTDTTFDSVEGYRQAGEKATDPQLKQALQQRQQQRENTLRQMNAELERQGDELVTKGTVTGEAREAMAKAADAEKTLVESTATERDDTTEDK